VNVKHGAKTAGSVFIPINLGLSLASDDDFALPPSFLEEEEEEDKDEDKEELIQ
jgi:hypothetical protein